MRKRFFIFVGLIIVLTCVFVYMAMKSGDGKPIKSESFGDCREGTRYERYYKWRSESDDYDKAVEAERNDTTLCVDDGIVIIELYP